jgi:hypothetical protein
MPNLPADTYASIDEANAEVHRLRMHVRQLETELAAARAVVSLQAKSHFSVKEPAASTELDALERFASQIETARTQSDPARTPDWERAGAARPGTQGQRNANDDVANRQLADLRTAISKLREERAQASVELLNLTRLNPDRFKKAAASSSVVPAPPASPPSALPPPAARDAAPAPSAAPAVESVAEGHVLAFPRTDASTPAAKGAEDGVARQPAATAQPADELAGAKPSHDTHAASDATALFPLEKVAEHGDRAAAPPADVFSSFGEADAAKPSARRWLAAVAAVALIGVGIAWAWATWGTPTRSDATPASEAVGAAPADTPSQGVPAGEAAAPGPNTVQAPSAAASQGTANAGSATPEPAGESEPAAAESAAVLDAPPLAASPPASGSRVELIVARDVWMRITVDGERRTENLVRGGQTLTFDVTRTIVIRAGDAGAVSATVNGQPRGRLGPDGAVLTRAFDVTVGKP